MSEIKQYIVSGEKLPGYVPHMMHSIPWILPFQEEEGKIIFQAEEGMITLSQWMSGEPAVEEIRRFIRSWKQLGQKTEDYFLEKERILTDPEWIFWNSEEQRICCVYLPFVDQEPLSLFRKWLPEGSRRTWETAMFVRMMLEAEKDRWVDQEKVLSLFELVRSTLPQTIPDMQTETAAGKWLRLKMKLQIVWEQKIRNRGSSDRDP